MSHDEIRLIASLIFQLMNALATVGVWIYVRYGDRNAEVDRKFATLEASMDLRIDSLEKHHAAMKSQMASSPTHSDLARIHTRIDEMARGISLIQGEFSGTSKTVDLIHNYLMNGGSKS
jgi:hypothetical protein